MSIIGLNPQIGSNFKTDQSIKITVHYHTNQDLGQVAIVLRVVRSDGVECCVMYSAADQFPIFINQGRGSISATLNPLQLFPGTYYVVATLKNKEETLVYDMLYSDWFHVEGNKASYLDLDAIYEPNRVWEHNTAASNEATDLSSSAPETMKQHPNKSI